jgi:hypothetical protein
MGGCAERWSRSRGEQRRTSLLDDRIIRARVDHRWHGMARYAHPPTTRSMAHPDTEYLRSDGQTHSDTHPEPWTSAVLPDIMTVTMVMTVMTVVHQ